MGKKISFNEMSGAYAALFTPYDAKGRVDAVTIARIMDYGYANGLKGFYLTGTTGEWWLLSTEERKAVYKAAAYVILCRREHRNGRSD